MKKYYWVFVEGTSVMLKSGLSYKNTPPLHPSTTNCKLTFIFERNSHISKSNQQLMDRAKSVCVCLSLSLSLILTLHVRVQIIIFDKAFQHNFQDKYHTH